ncbi:MAG: hypothetical protein HFI80_06235 [Lachnospiraceae bacterium]|jgi:hypothetical protein|nr:hypothetical protein [Lachnospiraceae bacterium]MCI9661126.1 hypothetical protein [Lachnospiraceae bacterium]
MGFRTGSYATVWSVEAASDMRTKARISISKRNKQSGEYETDFSGFVDFIGTAVARKASMLKEKDKIRLGDVDVSTKYVKEKNVTYTNFKVFSFETKAEIDAGGSGSSNGFFQEPSSPVDSGEVEDSLLPF